MGMLIPRCGDIWQTRTAEIRCNDLGGALRKIKRGGLRFGATILGNAISSMFLNDEENVHKRMYIKDYEYFSTCSIILKYGRTL